MMPAVPLSPQENLLLDEDSNIKLIDFGLVSEPDVCILLLYM